MKQRTLKNMIMRFDRQYRHLFVNFSSAKILNISISDFLGATHSDLGFPEDKCIIWEKALKSVFTSKLAQVLEFDIFLDGKVKYFEWRLIPEFDIYNNVASVLTIARDITEKIIAETKLKQYLDSKEKFFSILSHDLKSPLGTICNFSKLLADDVFNLSHKEISEYINVIADSSSNTYKLLEEILDWANNQGHIIKSNIIVLNLHEKLISNILLCKEKAYEKKINLHLECNTKQLAFADENMLNLIIRNLLSNAIKYTPKYGEIIVSVQNVNDDVIISVLDNGVGVPDKYHDSLLKIDSNFHTNGTSNEKGTGVGLKFCVEYANMMNGDLYFESNMKQGSEFFLRIPSKEKH